MPKAAGAGGANGAAGETEERAFSGWGRTSPSRAAVIAPGQEADVFGTVLRAAEVRNGARRRGVIARGLGRSYGDAAQCAGGVVVDTKNWAGSAPIDPDTGVVEVGAGVSLARAAPGRPPIGLVHPGDPRDAPGDDRRRDRRRHPRQEPPPRRQLLPARVARLTLATPTGIHEVGPDDDPELFWATAGGMGLTGIVTAARSSDAPVETVVDAGRHRAPRRPRRAS